MLNSEQGFYKVRQKTQGLVSETDQTLGDMKISNTSEGVRNNSIVLEKINHRKIKNPVKLSKVKARRDQSMPRQRKNKNSLMLGNTSLSKLPPASSYRGDVQGHKSVVPYRASKGYLEVYTANIVEKEKF